MIFHFADEGTLWVAKGCVLDNTVAIRPGDDVRHRLEDDSLHRTPGQVGCGVQVAREHESAPQLNIADGRGR